MSLSEQSQQWYPTSAQVTVLQARNLRVKGKNGTNDAYAIMQVAKDKFSTSVAEKSVSPEWKEEATFELPPLLHQAGAERYTLHVIVMHRALVGLDKLLGQAVVNLLQLHDNKSRKKTDWYKLVDKNGKADKERGEVLLDIQFMRNNMTASMFDLSMQDKPRSRISKLKDKVRGKKKEGLSDSASAIVPSTTSQVLTDSEGEGEGTPGQSPNIKKKSKLKSLFAPKTNLQKGFSQSMSTLGSLPEKNSSLSGSRSSGLNVESSDVKSKFKFLGHKRSGSNDSKASLGPFSLLSHSKQHNVQNEQNSLCINGSHVYAEDREPKPSSGSVFGSSLSLSSSAKGSIEDLRRYHERNASDVSADSFKGLSIPSYKPEPAERILHVQQRPHQEEKEEEENNKRAEGRLQELLDRQEEQEKKRQQEREDKRKKQEEEDRKKAEERERKRRDEEEDQQRKKREEEGRKVEEQKRQEELRVTERLTSLFGLGKKKEEVPPESPKREEVSTANTNPFEEIPLSPDNSNPFLEESPAQKEAKTNFTPTPPTSTFPGRTAKVSAVKPRLTLDPKPEPDNPNPFASPVTSDIQNTSPASTVSPKPTPSRDPFESFDMFSSLHSSLAPPKPQRTFSESPRGSMENLSGAGHNSSVNEMKRRSLPPPSYPETSKNEEPKNGRNPSESQQGQRPPLPLPDYEALYPTRRHGVMTSTRWEHIIAEVNQRKRSSLNKHSEEEMSVDAPQVSGHSKPLRTSSLDQTEARRLEPKQALIPPKSTISASTKQSEATSKQIHTPEALYATVDKSKRSAAAAKSSNVDPPPRVQSLQESQGSKKQTANAALVGPTSSSEPTEKPKAAARMVKTTSSSESNTDNEAKVVPVAKPRPKSKEMVEQFPPEASPHLTVKTSPESSQEERKNKLSTVSIPSEDRITPKPGSGSDSTDGVKTVQTKKKQPVTEFTTIPEEQLLESDPFPNDKLFSQDPWALPQQKMDQDDLFSGGSQKTETTLTPDVFDDIFGSVASKAEKDPFFQSDASKNENDPFFSSAPSKNQLDPFSGSVVSTEEKDPFFQSALKHENDPFFSSAPSKNLFFGSVASTKEEDPVCLPAESKNQTDSFFEPARSSKENNPFFGSDESEDKTKTKQSYSNSGTSSQKVQSQKKKLAPQPPRNVGKTAIKKNVRDKAVPKFTQDEEDVEITVTSVGTLNSSKTTTTTSKPDLWATDLLTSQSQMSTSSTTPEIQSGGKSTLRAWISPSEVHSTNSQSGGGGGGGGGAFTPRRPHPVKPMSSSESQPVSSIPLGKDLKTPTILEVAEKSKTVESGPYTQLTQEELITLVVKQQTELSKKDAKILELEDYIDNLLVRVIEEKPSILMALNSKC